MNMTRAILEGIAEVELEITPEFQKPEKPEGQLSSTVVEELLFSMGWTKNTSTVVNVPVVSGATQLMLETTWGYPGMAGTYIALVRQGSLDLSGTFQPDPGIAQVYYWRADWGAKEVAPYLDSIEEVASQLVKAYGPTWSGEGKLGYDYTLDADLRDAIDEISWMAAELDLGAPISQDNPVLVMVRSPYAPTAPEFDQLREYVIARDLYHQWVGGPSRFRVWPMKGQEPNKFSIEVRELLDDLVKHK